MRRISLFIAAVVAISATFIVVPGANQAAAQINIQLGGDFGHAKQSLINQGYTQIQVVGQGFTKFQIEACHSGVRYWFKSDSRGRINKKRQIGRCQNTVDINQARQILKTQGYSRINIEDRGGAFSAIACYRNDRVRVNVNHLGQVGRHRVLGSCRQSLSTTDVAASLKREGYTRIKFINRQLPVYVAEACLGKRQFRLELDGQANTISQRQLGKCRGPIDRRNLVRFLENKGFTRVVVIDDRLPRYVAEVCNKQKRVEITMNRYGDIIDRYKTGTCQTRIDRREIVKRLRQQGGSRIEVIREDRRGYTIEVCLDGEHIRFELGPYGQLQDERNIGQCKRYSIKQVKQQLGKHDFHNLEFYVQGCKKGKLVQFKVNEFGDRSERKVLGRCK